MRVFVDSSALVKRYINEKGSERVDLVCAEASEIAICVLAMPEIISSFCRLFRERKITEQNYVEMKEALLRDVRDMTIVDLTPGIVASSLTVLELYPLRAMDALHVASASEEGMDMFISSDQRELAAAEIVGLKTMKV